MIIDFMSPPTPKRRPISRDAAANRPAARAERAGLEHALRIALLRLPEAVVARILAEAWATPSRLGALSETFLRVAAARARDPARARGNRL